MLNKINMIILILLGINFNLYAEDSVFGEVSIPTNHDKVPGYIQDFIDEFGEGVSPEDVNWTFDYRRKGQYRFSLFPSDWGLDRINQRKLPLDDNVKHMYTGNKVHVYILDSGIRQTHTHFEGVKFGYSYDFVDNSSEIGSCGAAQPGKHHGTMVASIASGIKYGVARNAIIHDFRVMNCEGKPAGIGNAFNQVLKHNTRYPNSRAVVNLSLGGITGNTPENIAIWRNIINKIVAENIPVVVGAGNDNEDACKGLPAQIEAAITVAASNEKDERWEDSNFGTCVDVFAPGEDIWVANGYLGDYGAHTSSGTSLATPYVTGAIALYLEKNPKATMADIYRYIDVSSTKNELVAHTLKNSPNKLLYLEPKKDIPLDNQKIAAQMIPILMGILLE